MSGVAASAPPAAIERGVDASNILEINKPAERDILAKDHENQQRLDVVKGQWIESVVEAGKVPVPTETPCQLRYSA